MASSIYKENTNGIARNSYYKYGRIGLLSDAIMREFNTYSHWDEFDLAIPKIWDDDGNLSGVVQPNAKGKKSLFSNVAGVYSDIPLREEMNIPLLDSVDMRARIKENTKCSISDLVKASESGRMGRAIYNYSDFMYCKHLGRVPNNMLITLRKFPLPCGDHINVSTNVERAMDVNKHYPDMGRLVTWMGVSGNDLNKILSYSYQIPWDEQKAPLDETPEIVGGSEGGGMLGRLISTLDGTYAREIAETGGYGYKGSGGFMGLMGGDSGIERNYDLKDANRVVADRQNMIASVKVPGGKNGGLTFNHSIELVFEYELKSYDGINGRAAMLDLLGNVLMVTYLQGKFFPGSYRNNFMATSQLFTNMNTCKTRGSSDPMTQLTRLVSDLRGVGGEIIGGGSNSLTSMISGVRNIGSNLCSMLINGMGNKLGRPAVLAMTSLINPTPTGQWHLMIGNPRNPILSIGNLILTEATVEHNGPLGIDDFPTGLKVTVKLEHAKPRDSVAIEQMYMHGDHRIYTPMGKYVEDMYKGARQVKSKGGVDTTPSTDGVVNTPSRNRGGSVDPYMKYFGTTDADRIKLTSEEALVGGHYAKQFSKKHKHTHSIPSHADSSVTYHSDVDDDYDYNSMPSGSKSIFGKLYSKGEDDE